MYTTPPITRSRARGRAVVGSGNRHIEGVIQVNDEDLDATFQTECDVRNENCASAQEGNNIDMTQIQQIISNRVTMGINSLVNQLPSLIDIAVDNRFRQLNPTSSTSASSREQNNTTSEIVDNENKRVSPMIKWNLKFSGNSSGISVNDFVFRVETLKQKQNLTWSHVCANFHILLADRADEWYWIYLKRQGSSCVDLKSALIKEFRHRDTDFETLKVMMDFKQENNSFDQYIFRIMKLNEQMIQPLEHGKLLEIVRGNLNFRLWQLSFSARIGTFDELKEFCRNAERQLSSRQVVRRQVHEIEMSEQDESNLVEEMSMQVSNGRKMLSCWNCDQKGHSYFDCQNPQRRLFCYKCGQKDVTSPNCGKCKPHLNSQRDNLNPEQIRPELNPNLH